MRVLGDAGPKHEWNPRATAGSVIILIGSVGVIWAWRLGLWIDGRPGPGLWPFIVSVGLTTAGASVTAASLHGSEEKEDSSTSRTREIAAITSLACYISLFAYLGPALPTLALLLFWLRGLAREPWRTSLVSSVIGAAAIYVLFGKVLGIPLPTAYWSG